MTLEERMDHLKRVAKFPRFSGLEYPSGAMAGIAKESLEIIKELQQKNDLLQLEADKWKYLRENALNKAFDLAILNGELQEKVDYQQVALQEAEEIISCYKVEQDEWKDRFLQERRIKHKEYDTAKFKLDFLQGELIWALHYIRSCDNATQSAAKAIEMLKKYETI